MASNDGKAAEAAFVAHWERVGHVERFRDLRDLMGINKGKRIADFPKPSDFIVSAPGVPLHFAEVKSTMERDRFDFKCIRDGQSAAAQRSYLRGDRGYMFYIFSYPRGQWFIMTSEDYAHQLKMGRRSIKFEELKPWLK